MFFNLVKVRISLASKKLYLLLKEQAKKMRLYPTESERILWNTLKKEVSNEKFRRQHIIDQFIVDFCCLNKKLIIEVDGEIHKSQKGRDKERENILINHGFSVLRFTNEQIKNELDLVIKKVKKILESSHPL
jgi:leucyl-tRNA synthetase